MTELAICAAGLEKHFGALRAVDGLQLEVPKGAAFGLIGQNGAGKTTFIKLMLGIARPTAGSVQVFGRSPDDVSVRQRIGYLPERLQLPPALTPVAFLRSVGRLKGLARAEQEAQIPRVLKWVGLAEEAWDRPTGKFSKGMKQRTGLAAALLGDPDLLVLDEPTDGIDPVGRAQIRRVIQEAAAGGKTVFLNSHLLAETEKICSHVAVMNQGRVFTSGRIEDLVSENAYRVRFVTEGRDDVETIAISNGFEVDEESAAAGLLGRFRYQGKNLEGMSQALARCLAQDLHVVEVQPMMKDLESLLEASMTSGTDAGAGPKPAK